MLRLCCWHWHGVSHHEANCFSEQHYICCYIYVCSVSFKILIILFPASCMIRKLHLKTFIIMRRLQCNFNPIKPYFYIFGWKRRLRVHVCIRTVQMHTHNLCYERNKTYHKFCHFIAIKLHQRVHIMSMIFNTCYERNKIYHNFSSENCHLIAIKLHQLFT